MSTVISGFSLFTIAVGRKLILWWCYPVSKAVISVVFLVLCSISERDYYLYCGCLPLTWIYKGSETRMERMKDAWEGAVQDGTGRMAQETISVLIVFTKIQLRKRGETVCVCVCVCVWSVLLVCSLCWKGNFGEVEWLEWHCFPCAHSAFIIKHSCRGKNVVNVVSPKEMEYLFMD